MAKYHNHEEFGVNAPINYRQYTTEQAYLKGMSLIAPQGMKPRADRGQRFQQKTDTNASAKWHHNFDLAMFGGSEIHTREYEPDQLSLEQKINGVKRIPQTRR